MKLSSGILVALGSLAVASAEAALTVMDRFEIFEQLNRHQAYIDNDGSRAAAELFVDLYWPDATFTVIDPGSKRTVRGSKELKWLYDYDHSVYPLYQWQHSMGPFVMAGNANQASVNWRWRVDWKANATGVVSTGRYEDTFEKRDGLWKCLHRTSIDDPNWPVYLFAPYSALANQTFHES